MVKTALVSLNNVSKWFDLHQTPVIFNADISIQSGESVAITGPSGSGKTTLLYLMCGVEQASRGDISFDGLTNPDRKEWVNLRSNRIGLVFQAFNLLPQLSAIENIELPMLGQVSDKTTREEKSRLLLERMGLSDRAAHRPQELSGGEQQRVAIARSLVNSPDVLLCDEPTGNLDSQSGIQVMDMLQKVHTQDNKTLVIVTHNQGIASRCDRVIEIIDGTVL